MSGTGGAAAGSEAVLVDRLRVVEKDVARLRAAGARLGRQLHERARRDRVALEEALAASERRNATLERHLAAARRNARRAQSRATVAERRLEKALSSPTWRIGRAVMAGPRALRQRLDR
jgi:hypothetical protein